MKWFNLYEQQIKNTLFLIRKDKYRNEAIQQRRIYVLQTISRLHFHVSYAMKIVIQVHMRARQICSTNNDSSWRYFSSSSTNKESR